MADANRRSNPFHEWLSASAYVKGADQTARVLSRKKHRSKRNFGLSDLENEGLEAEERIRASYKLSNRHYRRWMNDRLLRELIPPMDAQEIGDLFAPPPWGERNASSLFERLSGFGEGWAKDKAAWEPFRNNVDMDVEARVLQYVAQHQGKRFSVGAQRHKAALKAWQGVSHKSRDALRRSSSWHLVRIFEEKILNCLEDLETGGSTCLPLYVGDAYHRMLIHGICEFHGLSSRTISHAGKEERVGELNVMVERKGKTSPKAGTTDDCPNMPLSLLQFLVTADQKTRRAAPSA